MNPAIIRLAKTVLKPHVGSVCHAESLRDLMVKRSKGSAALVAQMNPSDWGNLFNALKNDGVLQRHQHAFSHQAHRPDAKGHLMRWWLVR